MQPKRVINTSTLMEMVDQFCKCSLMWGRRIGLCLMKLSLNVCRWLGCKIMFSY